MVQWTRQIDPPRSPWDRDRWQLRSRGIPLLLDASVVSVSHPFYRGCAIVVEKRVVALPFTKFLPFIGTDSPWPTTRLFDSLSSPRSRLSPLSWITFFSGDQTSLACHFFHVMTNLGLLSLPHRHSIPLSRNSEHYLRSPNYHPPAADLCIG